MESCPTSGLSYSLVVATHTTTAPSDEPFVSPHGSFAPKLQLSSPEGQMPSPSTASAIPDIEQTRNQEWRTEHQAPSTEPHPDSPARGPHRSVPSPTPSHSHSHAPAPRPANGHQELSPGRADRPRFAKHGRRAWPAVGCRKVSRGRPADRARAEPCFVSRAVRAAWPCACAVESPSPRSDQSSHSVTLSLSSRLGLYDPLDGPDRAW